MNENIKSFNLINSKIIIFILVFVFVLGGIIIYNLFKNEEKIAYNFQPYPKFSPKSIPDINLGNDNSCYSILTKCINGACPDCTNDFECVTVDREGQYIINNTSVPLGDYCLPKVNKNDCNEITGTWVWVNDPEYCGEKGNQCWKCICRYPDLYDDSDSGCTLKKACNPPNMILQYSNDIYPSNVKLLSTDALLQDYKIPVGSEWDPINQITTPEQLKILNINPYGKNSVGKPYFQCDCSSVQPDGTYPYISLPNDPYVCNKNICDIDTNKVPGVLKDNKITCDCKKDGLFRIEGDNIFEGTCITNANLCQELKNTYPSNPTINSIQESDGVNVITSCNCDNVGFSQKCISINANISNIQCNDSWSDNTGTSIDGLSRCSDSLPNYLPRCSNENNIIGFECRNSCDLINSNYCNTGTISKKTSSGDGKNCTVTCNCPSGYRGNRCEQTCIPPGGINQNTYTDHTTGSIFTSAGPVSACCTSSDVVRNSDCLFPYTNCQWTCS